MKLYRFSPITTQEELFEAIKYLHQACNQLCLQSIGEYLPNAGNLGIFCHYDDEHAQLAAIRDQLAHPSDDPLQKYFKLKEPIVFPAENGAPETAYTHLYIRKPDIYRSQVGDIDFYLAQDQYDELKQRLLSGEKIPRARIFPRNDLDMVELYDPDVDVLAYISTDEMSQKVHVKLSEETVL